MTLPKPWREHVAKVLRDAEAQDWLAPPELPAECSYDPVTRRITTKAPITTVVAQDMLARGVAYIDSAGKFQLVEGDPLPPEQRTTHTIGITVRQVPE